MGRMLRKFCRTRLLRVLLPLVAAVQGYAISSYAASEAVAPVYFNLPEITTAINPTQQVVAQVSLRLAGPKTELKARDNMVRLRHAFVMRLADIDPNRIDAAMLESLADAYRDDANRVLSSEAAVRSVLLQKFVVQSK
jgi:flagellar basal body-associated protein FliL